MSDKLIEKINKVDFEAEVVRRFLGVPYENMGRSEKGIDCWGLGLKVYEMAGVKLFDMPEVQYDPSWSKSGCNYLAENYWREWEKVQKPSFLDAVLLKNAYGVAYHGGIILGEGKMIHATMYGVIISKIHEPKIKASIEGFYRLKKLYE